MKRLAEISDRKKAAQIPSFKRYLSGSIDWSQRLILILGHRGVGKTTLMLQNMQNSYVVADGIKTSGGTKIPLWLFGFLY